MLQHEYDPEDAAASAPEKPKTEDELDMTPMIDVTFLLLIFFLVTAAFALQKAFAVPRPDDDEAAAVEIIEEIEKDMVTVEIDENNVFWISGPAWEEKQRAVSSQEMRSRVRQSGEGVDGPGVTKMLVQAHGDAVHEKLVDALDAGAAMNMEIRMTIHEGDDF